MGSANRADPEQTKAALAAIVAALPHDRYIIVSPFHRFDTEAAGTAIFEIIVRLNRELAALYPNNFLDARTLLINLNDPRLAEDAANLRQQIPPDRVVWDYIHLNYEGYRAIARELLTMIRARGW
jgi:lysophospholipase L1-like esterase